MERITVVVGNLNRRSIKKTSGFFYGNIDSRHWVHPIIRHSNIREDYRCRIREFDLHTCNGLMTIDIQCDRDLHGLARIGVHDSRVTFKNRR